MRKQTLIALLCSLFLLLAVSASAKPVISVDLNVDKPGIQADRTAIVGETFRVALVLSDDGEGREKTEFDTIILGVFYNDQEPGVLGVTPAVYPHAGELANNSPTVTDAFSGNRLNRNQEMTLLPLTGSDLPKGFRNSAGQAGLQDLTHRFSVTKASAAGGSDSSTTIAQGKLNAGFLSRTVGSSTVFAAGPAGGPALFLDGRAVDATFVPAHVKVIPQVQP